MRRICILVALVIFAAIPVKPALAQTSLGGLSILDNLKTLFKAMDIPDAIRATRATKEINDAAIVVYQRQGSIAAILTPYGDRINFLLSESPAIKTNDGLAVGDLQSLVITKRGEPEKTESLSPGVTTYWYYSQGIHFCIDDKSSKIRDIFLFPPSKSKGDVDKAALTGDVIGTEHRYSTSGSEAFIVGVASNKTFGLQHGVKVEILLMDSNGSPLDVISSEIGDLPANASAPFKIGITPKGKWAKYRVFVQGSTSDSNRYSDIHTMLIKSGSQ